MARPSKSLHEVLRDGTFRARRHGGLLAGPLVRSRALREIQEAWQEADSEAVRRALALQFQKAVAGDASVAAVRHDFTMPFAEFSAEHLIHAKGDAGGMAFVLEPWQREWVDEFDRVDELGCRIYGRGVLGVPRGNGKTSLAGGRSLYDLVTRTDAPDVFCCAASRDQARITLDYARLFAAQGALADVLEVGRHEIRNPLNNGTLKALSADGRLQHGSTPASVTLDELHAFQTEKQRELFEAIDTSVGKRDDAYWLAITTATGDRGSLLGTLLAEIQERYEIERLQKGLWIARDEATGFLAFWYGASEDDDFSDEKLWRRVNPGSWVSIERLRKAHASPSMSTSTFARLHLNAPVLSERERWIPLPDWDRLGDGASIPEGVDVYLGWDGSRTHDTTAVALAHRATDERIDVSVKVFSTRPDAAHHVLHEGGRINFADVEDVVVDLFDVYRVLETGYDPRYLDRSAELLETRMPETAIFAVEPSSRFMRDALAALERGVLDGVLRHDGDPVLREHLAWCAADRADSGELRRVSKADRTRPIDGVIALALAFWRASLDEGGSVYDRRGLLVV